MTTSTIETLMAQMSAQVPFTEKETDDKVTVVGAGSVGISCLYALVTKKISNDLVLIDKDLNEAEDEFNDIQNASVFMGQPGLTFSSEYEVSNYSKVIVLTAGQMLTLEDENLDLNILKKNIDIFREIIPEIMAYSPKCILLVVTQPVDIMSYIAWKLSGLPPHRVIGTGCALTSARFRYSIAQKLGISTQVVQAYVIGENGPKCVPVWTGVTACGIRLRDINPLLGSVNDPEDWDQVFHDILKSAYHILMKKSFNTWGMAAAVAKIVSVVITNSKECISVSTHIKGCRHGVDKDKDVFLSLPCILGSNGVCYIVRQALSEQEKDQLQESADKLNKIQAELDI